MGAVELFNNVGGLLTTTPIYGIGQRPEVVYGPTINGAFILDGPSLENVVSTPGYALSPRAMATDAAGDLFVADSTNPRVLEIPANGTPSLVGVGLGSPQSLALDGAGDLFIADTGNQEVLEVPAGCTTSACQTVAYKPTPADPIGLAVDGMGDLFIVDDAISGIVEIPAGCTSSSCQIPIENGEWSDPSGLAVGAAGDLFVADSGLEQVIEVPAGCTVSSCQIKIGGVWVFPHGVAVDAAGDVYVADSGLGAAGEVVEVPAGCTSNACKVVLLSGLSYDVAVDAAGRVYITDATSEQILKINQAQPPSESFNTTYVGFTSDDSPQSFSVLNVGNQTLNAISPGLVVTGPNFIQVAGTGTPADCTSTFSLAPGADCNLSTSFTPQIEGLLTSTAALTDNNLNGAPGTQNITLSGGASNPVETLNLAGGGTGNGSVIASPTGINCSILAGLASGPTCSSSYIGGEGVSLEEIPAPGYTFAGWGDVCASAGTSQFCNINVNVNTSTTVTASFAVATATTYTLSVTEVGTGTGRVTDNLGQISCSEAGGVVSGTCLSGYSSGSTVTLTANASGNSIFGGWSGTCASAGTSPTCNVLMNSAANATATFVQVNFGNVNVCPSGQATPAPCSNSLPLTFNFATATMIGAIQVVTQGVSGLDFSLGSGSTCSGTVAAGNTCIVNVNFTPLAPGWRMGAAKLFDNNGILIATEPVYGNGQAPEIAFGPGTQTTVNTGAFPLSNPKGVLVDAAGNLFISDATLQEVVKIALNGSVSTVGFGFQFPQGMAEDGAGDLFIADFGLKKVIEVPAGCANSSCQITIGGGWSQVDDVAVDAAGDVFVADQGLQQIVEVPAGCTGVACQAVLVGGVNTIAVAVDAFGDLVFDDLTNRQVLEVNRSQPQSLSFALTSEGSTSVDSPQSVTIQNVGNQLLTATLTPVPDTNFVENPGSTCGNSFSLHPGAICSEGFSFTPQTTGNLTDVAYFSDNSLNLAASVVAQAVNLSGVGDIAGQAATALVPNVVGMTQAAATTALTGAGLALGSVSSAYSDGEAAGSVIGENPAAGAQVTPGSAVKLLISIGEAPPPTPNPLTFENNYFVTGDYASAGVALRGAPIVNGMATGTITIPNSTSPGGVPSGADIIDAFLYWQTLESTATPSANTGTFLGYSITGQQIGSDLPYTDAATGLSGTLRAYRADVNVYLPMGTNGVRLASGSFPVTLPDGGTALPLTQGASLVVIYRALVAPNSTNPPSLPLKAVIIYDGSAIPAGSTTQNMQGFYDAVGGAPAQEKVRPTTPQAPAGATTPVQSRSDNRTSTPRRRMQATPTSQRLFRRP